MAYMMLQDKILCWDDLTFTALPVSGHRFRFIRMIIQVVYVLADFFISFQYMPSCIMYVTMCPNGSEGITYAMLTTMRSASEPIAIQRSTSL